MADFEKRKRCPTCNVHFAYYDAIFFKCCPLCGGWGEFMSSKFFGWPGATMRLVYTPNPSYVWWRPSTWSGTHHWEYPDGSRVPTAEELNAKGISHG
jgi:hypothetical protein